MVMIGIVDPFILIISLMISQGRSIGSE